MPKILIYYLKRIIPILMIILISFEAKELFRNIDWPLLMEYLHELSAEKVGLVLILGFLAMLPMCFYDVILIKLHDLAIKKAQLFIYSVSANAFSNLVGFGGVAGVALRTYYYRPYINTQKKVYVKNIAKLSLFYLSGLSLLAIPILFQKNHLFEEIKWIEFGVWLIALYTPIFLIFLSINKSFWHFSHCKNSLKIELIFISMIEWLCIVGCIWVICSLLNISIPLSILYPIVIIASCAAVLSMVPGGLGSFDLVFLLGLEAYGVGTELSLLVLMLYRISYYIVPVLIISPFTLCNLWSNWGRKT